MDVEIVIQRLVTARLGRVPEQFALYACSKDSALGISNWLFGGSSRLGKISSKMFSPAELAALRTRRSVQIIDARISDPGPHGHSYFHSNPAVSSDLMLLLRYHQMPGPQRPLQADPSGFWFITDKYPQTTWNPPAETPPPPP